MGEKIIRLFTYLNIIAVVVYSCTFQSEEELFPDSSDLLINLRWFKGSFDQTEDEMRTGLTWALSSLGAELPSGSLDKAMNTINQHVFTLDLTKVGFNDPAKKALYTVIEVLKKSPAYQNKEYTELGRFMALTLNSSYHYYKITGVPETLSEFKASYKFEGKQVRVINSSVSKVQRLIEVAEANAFEEIAYFSIESSGNFEDETFRTEEFETLSFMSNGQLKFGLYNNNGRLKDASNPEFSSAQLGNHPNAYGAMEQQLDPFLRIILYSMGMVF